MLGIILRLIVFIFPLIITACKSKGQTEITETELALVASYPLLIDQPSGITINQDNTAYWIVDGGSDKVVKTDLKGQVLQTLSYKGNDLEGISYDKKDSTLWVVEEREREIVHLDLSGKELGRYKTKTPGTDNNGLEGIALDNDQNAYVINEKEPVAFFSLNKDFTVLKKYTLDFADDISDIVYNNNADNYYILSDESKALFIWSPQKGLEQKYLLPFAKAEGITINTLNNRIIIVNDALNTLYEYEIRQVNK
jgi:uncharacterized protein YjiK